MAVGQAGLSGNVIDMSSEVACQAARSGALCALWGMPAADSAWCWLRQALKVLLSMDPRRRLVLIGLISANVGIQGRIASDGDER